MTVTHSSYKKSHTVKIMKLNKYSPLITAACLNLAAHALSTSKNAEECTNKVIREPTKYEQDTTKSGNWIVESCFDNTTKECRSWEEIDLCFGRDETEREACKIEVSDRVNYPWLTEFHTCFKSESDECYSWTDFKDFNKCNSYDTEPVEGVSEDNTGAEAAIPTVGLVGGGLLVLIILFLIAYFACCGKEKNYAEGIQNGEQLK